MRILHYSLGFPPYRTGGLTKFCMDLMLEQKKEGHEVALIWPGEIKLFDHSTHVKKGKAVRGIENYEVINPTPVPYDEGILDIPAFMEEGDASAYEKFLIDFKPGVIHVHTLMGLHKNFLVTAKKLGIRTVFTTHDFFPICPKVTMFRDNMVCPDTASCESCPHCNLTALSLKKIQILQSLAYRDFKDSPLIKKLRKEHRDEYLSGEVKTEGQPIRTSEDYKNLRKFYLSELELIDVIHYNSSISKMVYEKFFTPNESEIIPITHGDIADHRKKKQFGEKIRISYLAAQSKAKGYYLLRDALDQLWKVNHNFVLNVFFAPTESRPYIKTHSRYTYEQLEKIFNETDIMAAPSLLYETFGYTVIEALSFGVPVLISNHVGARDVVPNGGKIEFQSAEQLCNEVKNITVEKLRLMNEEILQSNCILTMPKLPGKFITLYASNK